MSKKLTTITSTYSAFAKDQLLTHTDLNQVIDYFEDQDRLSRICLNGVGIVCGFEPTFVQNDGNPLLAISQGSGVTTDGDLLHFLFDNENVTNSLVEGLPVDNLSKVKDYLLLSQFRVFNDTDANYPQFQNDLSVQIPLLELLPATAGTGSPITEDIFTNRTLLLYLDCYSKEAGACTAISCDSQGVEQVRVLRVLLVNNDEIDIVNKHDYLFKANDVAQRYLSLSNVGVPRVIVNNTNTANAADLAESYEEAVLDSGMLSNLTDNLGVIGLHVDYDTTALLAGINNNLSTSAIGNTLFQYNYDLFKDLVDAYQELRALYIEHYPSCCPDIYPFPKHLWLGEPNTVASQDDLPFEFIADQKDFWEENNTNRHKFYPSPILTQKYSARQHLIAVFERMLEMVNGYGATTALSTDDVRITPSNAHAPIAKRAIPFYYDPQYDADNDSRLVRLWDFKRGTLRQYDEILGYNQVDASSNPLVFNPLQFNLNAYDFFRIEGHQGLLYQDALERVNQIRDQYALGFDTKVLGISVDASQTINIDDYTCDFVDLAGQLETCKDMQYCLFEFASQLLSGYSIEANDEGFNHNTADLMGRQTIFTLAPGTIATPGFTFDDFSTSTGTSFTSGDSATSGATLGTTDTTARFATTNNIDSISRQASFSEFDSGQQSSSQEQQQSNLALPQLELAQNAFELQQELGQLTINNLADLDNPIVRNLYDGDDGLGTIVFDAFQRYVGTNSETTYQYMEFQIDALTGPGGALENWNDDIKDANLYLPAKILSSAYAASLLIPDTLNALTPALIANYQTEIDRLCSYVRQYKSSYETLRTAQNTSVSDDLYALSELVSANMASLCCAGDKLQSILDQIDARKLEILTGLELAQFAQEHQGMEHMAGVPKGGTFIMAYAFNETGEGAIQDGTVIADFALPYLCCSDCRPVNFIVPKNTVSLLLSSSVICIDASAGDAITVETTVTPIGGTVALLNDVPGVTVDPDSNNIIVTPATFDASQFNTPIEFTVDGQFTNATLTVVEPATVGITASPAVSGEPTSNTSFVFYATGFGSDDTIIWDFGDGTSGTGQVASHEYTLPIEGNSVTVQLTVIPPNGACPATDTLDITFAEVTVSLDQTDFCEDDPAFPFTITPAGANPNITGEGVSSDQKFFVPSATPAGGGNYTLFVDGTEFAVARVFPAPTAAINPSIDQDARLFILDAAVEHVDPDGLRWAFYDPINPDVELQRPKAVQGQPKITVPFDEVGEPGTRRIARLFASAPSGAPCAQVTDEVVITVPTLAVEDNISNPTA